MENMTMVGQIYGVTGISKMEKSKNKLDQVLKDLEEMEYKGIISEKDNEYYKPLKNLIDMGGIYEIFGTDSLGQRAIKFLMSLVTSKYNDYLRLIIKDDMLRLATNDEEADMVIKNKVIGLNMQEKDGKMTIENELENGMIISVEKLGEQKLLGDKILRRFSYIGEGLIEIDGKLYNVGNVCDYITNIHGKYVTYDDLIGLLNIYKEYRTNWVRYVGTSNKLKMNLDLMGKISVKDLNIYDRGIYIRDMKDMYILIEGSKDKGYTLINLDYISEGVGVFNVTKKSIKKVTYDDLITNYMVETCITGHINKRAKLLEMNKDKLKGIVSGKLKKVKFLGVTRDGY